MEKEDEDDIFGIMGKGNADNRHYYEQFRKDPFEIKKGKKKKKKKGEKDDAALSSIPLAPSLPLPPSLPPSRLLLSPYPKITENKKVQTTPNHRN